VALDCFASLAMTGRGQRKTSPRHCEALLRRSNPVFLRKVHGRSCFLINALDICFFLGALATSATVNQPKIVLQGDIFFRLHSRSAAARLATANGINRDQIVQEGTMTNGTTAETPRQKLAQGAREKDVQAANEGARAATQAAILINGGAATAILAFLSAYLTKSPTPPPVIFTAAALSLIGYAFGVCFAVMSIWCSSQAATQFGLRWEAFLDNDKTGEDVLLKAGNGWISWHRCSFAASIVLFFLSSLTMAGALFAAMK
jgi:hypothetical protein